MVTFVENRRPETDEYSEYFGRYVNEVPEGNIMEILQEQLTSVPALLEGLSDEQALYRPSPQDWSVKEVVCHINDVERVFIYRALRMARGDTTPLPGFEQDPYVAAANADVRPLADLLDEFRSIRQSALWLFRSLPPEAWDRRGTASNVTFSVRAFSYIAAGHVIHHVKSLKEVYLK